MIVGAWISCLITSLPENESEVLTVVDNFTKISPVIDVVNSLRQATVIHGLPKVIKVDNGPEFISKELDLWA